MAIRCSADGGAGFNQPFIGDVREDESLDSNEARLAGQRRSESARIRAGKNLNPEG